MLEKNDRYAIASSHQELQFSSVEHFGIYLMQFVCQMMTTRIIFKSPDIVSAHLDHDQFTFVENCAKILPFFSSQPHSRSLVQQN